MSIEDALWGTEQNKAVVRRVLEEVWNEGNLALIDELVEATHVDHDSPPGLPSGSAGMKQFVSMFRTAFPDLHSIVEDQVAEGDKVVTRWTAAGTHRGSLMGIPATGKEVTMTGITINRLAGGKVVETWNTFDQLGLMQQLGVVPPPGQAGS
jgi:steroid delta-isomerase-like uncharacterized protein